MITHLYGIIGKPLAQSFSPTYFNTKFADLSIAATHHYTKFELNSIEELTQVLHENANLKGLNVTIPYKQQVLPFVQQLHETAEACGAVNCIKVIQNTLIGYNTDAIGFEESLLSLLQPQHTKALVLGTGGASKAVLYVLKKLGIQYSVVSRTKTESTITYTELTESILKENNIIINCTPLGMTPNEETFPTIPYEHITNKHLLYDLIYKPAETLFLQKGKAQGATIKNGHEMLLLQAEANWKIWNSPSNLPKGEALRP